MKLLEFENISMDYGNKIEVISNLSFDVNKGGIFTLLGPSGCGKSTILRMIAGLEIPSKGSIKIDGVTVFDDKINLSPDKRKIGFVFQDYALFPHLNVFENIAFSLYKKNISLYKNSIGLSRNDNDFKRNRVKELLEIVNMPKFENRYPHELSGGQQQRIALARALANEPSLLLMDEPFSNLDTSLREKMRLDIYNIIKKTKITAIFVTHDQGEALSMSDNIAFLKDGKMSQIGTPHELYWDPFDICTASFMGKANIFDVYLDENKRDNIFSIIISSLDYDSCKAKLCIRPELIEVNVNGAYIGIVEHFSFIGSCIEVTLKYTSNQNTVLLTAIAKPFMKIEKNMTIKFDIDSKGLIVWKN